ncbi:transmembrane protein 42 [Orussus abietinus]|uniref:transmembrane protein 42 n=1 Tax=Orussus abietinus TaxID=222816 RepID=UPI0006263554|nr:transmembrane protein 42 [Orussus abietinus]
MASYKRGAQMAVVAGMFATTGSTIGKMAGEVAMTSSLFVLLKVFLLGLMVTSNTAGCMLFVKALQQSESSLPMTLITSATSYFCSALVGFLVFGESTSLTWWGGTTLVLLGLLLVCHSPVKDFKEKSKKE